MNIEEEVKQQPRLPRFEEFNNMRLQNNNQNQIERRQKANQQPRRFKEQYNGQFVKQKRGKREKGFYKAVREQVRMEVANLKAMNELRIEAHKPVNYQALVNDYDTGKLSQTEKGFITEPAKGPGEQRQLKMYFGNKVIHKLQPDFDTLSSRDKLIALRLAIMDDYEIGDGDIMPEGRQLLRSLDNYGQKILSWIPKKNMNSCTLTPNLESSINQNKTVIQTSDHYHFDAISPEYIMSYLCPEDFHSRRPSTAPVKTAIAQAKVMYQITTNSAGASCMYIIPNNPCASGIGIAVQNGFIFTYNQSGFNPVAGTSGGTFASTANVFQGPLYPFASQVQSYVPSCMSVQIEPNISLTQSQGLIQMVYFQKSPNGTFNTQSSTATPSITQAVLPFMPYYQQGPLTDKYRMIRIPTDDDLMFQSDPVQTSAQVVPPITEGFYILVTGATPSSIVATIMISYVYEVIPTDSSMPIMNTDYSRPGTATMACVQNITRQFPNVQSAPYAGASKLAQSLNSSGSLTHDHTLSTISNAIYHIPERRSECIVPLIQDHFLQSPNADIFSE